MNQACIAAEVLEDQRLKWNDIGLLVFLCGIGRVDIEAAIKTGRSGKNAIYDSLKRLRNAGYVGYEKKRDGSTEWTLEPHTQNRDLGMTLIPKTGIRHNGAGYKAISENIIQCLNDVAGRNYRPTKTNLDLVTARLKEGFTQQEIESVIHHKNNEWSNNDKMSQYLRPATLFNRTKFNQYIGEIGAQQPKNGADQWLSEETERDNIINGVFHHAGQ